MQAIDSQKNPLPAPEVILRFVQDYNDSGYSPQHVLAAIAEELTLPNTDQVQVGNTVFIGHTGTGKHENVMDGRALNIDTARNFMRNGLKYIAYLQNKGVRYYRTDFNEKSYVTAFQFWYNKSQGSDTEIDVVQLEDGSYRAYIYIGDEPLKEFWRV